MVKTGGPLMGLEAKGSLAKAVTFQGRPGGTVAHMYKKPKVPLTYLQIQQRSLIASATAYWQSLSDAEKEEWEKKAEGTGQSGNSYMIRQYCKLNFDRPLWLPMNEGSGSKVYDKSGHKNNGTIYGATWTTLPSGKPILSFDGLDDSINCGSDGSLDNLAAITLIAWVNLVSLGEQDCGRIFNKTIGNKVGGGWHFFTYKNNTLIFSVDHDTTDIMRQSATNAITLGIPQMVAITWDGSTTATNIKFYVNGAETRYGLKTNGDGGRVDDSAQSVLIGNVPGSDRTADGLIGGCLINNRVKSAGEIMADFKRERALYGV